MLAQVFFFFFFDTTIVFTYKYVSQSAWRLQLCTITYWNNKDCHPPWSIRLTFFFYNFFIVVTWKVGFVSYDIYTHIPRWLHRFWKAQTCRNVFLTTCIAIFFFYFLIFPLALFFPLVMQQSCLTSVNHLRDLSISAKETTAEAVMHVVWIDFVRRTLVFQVI